MAMRSVSAFRFTLLVLTLAATLLPSPVQARDGRVLVGSKPLAHTFRSKKGVRYYPLAEVCKAFSIPTTAVPKEHLLTIESPLAGKVHLLLAKGEAQVGGKVVRLDPAPIERDRVWFVPEHFVAGTLGIVGESTKGGPDVSLAARAHVAEGPQGLQLIAAAPLIAKGFYLDNPPRYVLDLPNCILDRRYAAPFVSTEPGYSAIRVGQFSAAPFVTRVVYDLTSNGFRPDAAKAKGASRLRLGAARPDTLFPSFKVTIGLAPDGGAVVVEGLLATDATLERNDEGTLAVLFSRAHLAGTPSDYHYRDGMTDTGIRRIHLENVDDDQVRMVVQSATPIAQPRVRYDPATNRATIRLKPSAPLPEPPKAGTPKGKGLQGKVIVVDAGHGGHDPGAAMEPGDVGPVRLLEKDVNLRMALDLAARLRRAAATVVLSREDDRFIELLSRKELIDTHKADLFISIHCNSFRKVPSTALSGTEVYYYKGADEAVANLFYRHIAARTGRGGRGALQANFVVCKHPSVPSVLVESGYLSNPDEYELFIDKDHKYEQTLVTGIMEATAAFFNGERSLPSSDPEVFTEVIMDPEVVLGELARHTVLDLPGAPLAAPSSPYEGGSEPSTPTPAQPSTRNDRPSRGDIFRPTPEHKEAESPQAERRRRIFSLE